MTSWVDNWLGAKDVMVAVSGVSRDGLHLALGLSLFVLATRFAPRRLMSLSAWSSVLGLELVNEVVDQAVSLACTGMLDLAASWHDVVNTMTLPTLVLTCSRAWTAWKPIRRRTRRVAAA